MRIAIDSGPLSSGHSVRGIGTYVSKLSRALKIQISKSKIQIDTVDFRNSEFLLSGYDIVHFTSFKPFEIFLPFAKPKNTKFVLTIYDLIPLIYPGHYPPGAKGRLNWQINKFLIRKNANVIITISETSKKDICRLIGIDPDKVFVTYLSAGPIFKKLEISNLELVKKKYNLPERFALYVGDINYNKNIPNLVKASQIAKMPLVIAGKQAKEIGNLDLSHPELNHLKGVDWSNVIRCGFVPDETLVELYNLAAVYVQPSFYEGFGLPLLEAYECGIPIAVSKNQCHVEIMGDDFEYFDPKSPEEIAKKILAPNRNKKLPRLYSWEKTAEGTLNVYAKI